MNAPISPNPNIIEYYLHKPRWLEILFQCTCTYSVALKDGRDRAFPLFPLSPPPPHFLRSTLSNTSIQSTNKTPPPHPRSRPLKEKVHVGKTPKEINQITMGGGTNSPPPTVTKEKLTSQAPLLLPLPLRILTHNIRYATTSPFPGEKLWVIRKPKLLSQLHYHTRHLAHSVIFLQEVLDRQRIDILDSLNSDSFRTAPSEKGSWEYVGVGRDDGVSAGEFSPILFRGDVWMKVEGSESTVWLNEDGRVGGKGWDAASVRILTTVVLECDMGGNGKTKKRVLLMNTHLDDQGRKSREESARILLTECRARRERWDVDAVVLGGDLNSEAGGDAYTILAKYEESGVVDVRMLAAKNGEEQVYGEENTFTGFDGKGDGEGVKRIDFLFLGMKEGEDLDLSATAYAVLPNRFEDGVYLSDHRAVVADLVI